MSDVIVARKSIQPEVITGLDLFATQVGDEKDKDFAEKKHGPG
jgi:hypothetical protein